MESVKTKDNNPDVIVIKDLNKTFKKYKALDNLSFKVKTGQLFGFLGLNGAGKTTTLNIILGLLNRDSGQIYIDGQNIDKDLASVRQKIGIVFQQSILDDKLNIYENLIVRAQMYKDYLKQQNLTPQKAVEEIIRDFQLEDILDRNYGSLSGGQKRRTDIARALVHKPKILFLDEPTTGLDPFSRKLVWDILTKIQNEKQLTILLTTHYMEEANNCDYSIIIDKGVKLVEGHVFDLKTKYATTQLKIYNTKENPELEKQLKLTNAKVTKTNLNYTCYFKNYEEAKIFCEQNLKYFENFELIKGTMDEVFLNVTNNPEINKNLKKENINNV
ncbi:ABC transporter ATP-binding protein [Mycoplasmopsis ciconiae]|uniref:ABC transporter ATP-binding protein n=1 Tax=Mycoplasmopsis ciconiae TaxID=561067 RepID=A0ABU7MLF3_9BACT|nr:ABC transporter ATP-binding protein [Mycoplasmopsis ciconiae]